LKPAAIIRILLKTQRDSKAGTPGQMITIQFSRG
jgi:hypothetical protein